LYEDNPWYKKQDIEGTIMIDIVANDRHFSYDNEIELIQFIASEMQIQGLDVINEENLDSYLNTKIM
jgi:hypothetical protein